MISSSGQYLFWWGLATDYYRLCLLARELIDSLHAHTTLYTDFKDTQATNTKMKRVYQTTFFRRAHVLFLSIGWSRASRAYHARRACCCAMLPLYARIFFFSRSHWCLHYFGRAITTWQLIDYRIASAGFERKISVIVAAPTAAAPHAPRAILPHASLFPYIDEADALIYLGWCLPQRAWEYGLFRLCFFDANVMRLMF